MPVSPATHATTLRNATRSRWRCRAARRPRTCRTLPDQPTNLLSVVPPPNGTANTGEAVRDALDHAQRIEQLLAPTPTQQQGS